MGYTIISDEILGRGNPRFLPKMPHNTSSKKGKNEVACMSSERREAIKKTIQRRDECKKKAAKIVEEMLEVSVSQEWLLGALHDLSQQDYQDAVEERAILLYCGYPICQNKLTRVPTQKYRICVKTNKVYDITERKEYCSDSCYHASVFLKKQLHDGPLWLRDETEATTDYELLEKQKQRGWRGEEVDFGWQRLTPDEAEELRKAQDTAKRYVKAKESNVSPYMSEDAIQKLGARVERLCVSSRPGTSLQERESTKQDTQDASSRAEPSQEIEAKERAAANESRPLKKPQLSKTSPEQKASSSSAPIKNCKPGTTDYSSWFRALRSERQGVVSNCTTSNGDLTPQKEAEKALTQWTTVETLTLVLGKEAMNRLKASQSAAAALSASQARADRYGSLYARICSMLDKEEAEDDKLDSKLLDSDDDDEAPVEPRAPMPSMEDLKRDADAARLKVLGFYNGDIDTVDEEEHTGVTASKETEERDVKVPKQGSKRLSKKKAPAIPPDTKEPLLPVVDSHAQNLLRCRILLDRLHKILPDILDLLDVELAQISADLRELVTTFRLTAENVVLKVPTCRIIAVCLTLMLSKRNRALHKALADERQRSCLGPFMDDLSISFPEVQCLVDTVLNPGTMP